MTILLVFAAILNLNETQAQSMQVASVSSTSQTENYSAIVNNQETASLTITCPANFMVRNTPNTCEGIVDFNIKGMFAVNGDYFGNGSDRGAFMSLDTTTGMGTVLGTPISGRSLLGLAQSEGVIYAVADGREFITIATDGSLASTITIFNSPVWDLAVHPDTGVLYGVKTENNVTNTLVTIDKTTGAITPIGSPIPMEDATELAIGFAPDGTLYGLQTDNVANAGGNLLVIDPATGNITNEITLSTHLGAAGLGVDENGLIYISECCNSGAPFANNIWTIDPSTGNTTLVGSSGGGRFVMDIAFIDFGAIATSTNDISSITYTPASGSVLPVGVTTVTATATDTAGNTASCNFEVTVVDRDPPTITCPSNIVANSEPDVCGAIVNLVEQPVVSDLCSASEDIVITQTGGPTFGTVFPVGFTQVELTATDEAGNSSSCNLIVEVVDIQTPTYTRADIVAINETDTCGATVTFNTPIPNDNCPLPPQSVPQFTLLGSFEGSTYFISNATYLGIFAFDHANTNGVNIVTINSIEENDFLSDAVANYFTTDMSVFIGYLDRGNSDRSWHNLDTTTFTNWDVNQPGAATIFFTELSSATGKWTAANPFSTQRHYIIEYNGGAIKQVSGPPSGSTFSVGNTLVEFSYTDGGGNEAVCSFDVIVEDRQTPAITCPPDTTVTADDISMTYEVPDYFALAEATTTDNCTDPITIITQTPVPGTELSAGVYSITLTSEDTSGNINTCSFELTVDTTLSVENQDSLSFQLYPNPVKNELFINGLTETAELIIFSIDGSKVFKQKLTNSGSVDISFLATGMYLLKINQGQNSKIVKLIKK